VTREVLTGRGIDDFPFPTRKSARLRLERFWKERGMEREKKEGQVGTNTVHGRTDMQGRRGVEPLEVALFPRDASRPKRGNSPVVRYPLVQLSKLRTQPK